MINRHLSIGQHRAMLINRCGTGMLFLPNKLETVT